MKRFFTLLGLILPLAASAATAPHTIPNDQLQVGKSAAGDKTIIINKGAGASNPKIKWNNTTSKLQFSNDGTNYLDIGAGGGAVTNALAKSNGDFQAGTTGWTASGGTFTSTTAAANILPPFTSSGSWDSNGVGQTLTSTGVVITSGDGLSGQNITGGLYLKCATGTCTHKVQIYDGTNVLAENTITSSTSSFVPTYISVGAPASGTLYLRLISVAADEPIIYPVNAYFGRADGFNLFQVSQASLYGSLNYAATANCTWPNTNTSYTDFPFDTDCPTPTVTGFASAPGTKIPGVTFTSLPPGDYLVMVGISTSKSGGPTLVGYRWHDGTNSGGDHFTDSTASNVPVTVTGRFSYTTAQSNITFRLQGFRTGGTNVQIANEDNPFQVKVYRFPTSAETAYRPDLAAWFVDATISGANPSLGTSSVSSYTGIENGSLTLTNRTGAIAAQIPCSSTNSPSGTTCSAGNESVGVSWNLPRTGTVRACASFAHDISNVATSVYSTFQIVETPNNAQTISQEGGSKIQSGNNSANTGTTIPHQVCGTFVFTSSGQKTLRLMYEQSVSGTPTHSRLNADGDTSLGQRDIRWEVYPVDQGIPAPLLVGSVTSNSSGLERVERVMVSEDPSACTASPCTITNQSGNWVSSVTRSGTGTYTVNVNAGIFSSKPSCFVTSQVGGAARWCNNNGANTTTAIPIACASNSGASIDMAFQVLCMGPR